MQSVSSNHDKTQETPLVLTDIKKETYKEKFFRILALLTIILFPFALLCCFKVVKQYTRAIVLRFGRVRSDSPAGPGIIWVLPCTDVTILVDLRTQTLNLPTQEVLTKDSVTVTVDAIAYYHVLKPLDCVLNIQSHKYATELIAVAMLRNIIGQYNLSEVLSCRDLIGRLTRKAIDEVTIEWGVEIECVEIKDVQLPYELQKAMAAEAEGSRIAKAKIVDSAGEIKAAENLRHASRIMMENPQTMLLRYLQTLTFIASQQKFRIHVVVRRVWYPNNIPGSIREWKPRDPKKIPVRTAEVKSERPTERNPNKMTKNSNLDDIKIMNTNEDTQNIEPTPRTSKNKGTENTKDPNEPTREDSEESNESYAGRFVRLPLNKGPDTCIERILIFLSYMLVLISFPFSIFFIFVVVRQFERAVILRNGKVLKNNVSGPGLVHYLPCIDVIKFLDLRIICYAVPPQEALTKDSLTVSIDAVVYYKICDPISAVINVADYRSSTQFLAATMLRNALGTRKLAELLMDRPAVCYQIFHSMKRVAHDWGIKIVRVEVKEISLPIQLQKAMAAEAESSRLANAKIIVAKSEIESTKNLQIATSILMDNPLCMQLRYLQSLQMISGDQTHTIVFPFSIEHLRKIFK